ncbi:MAG: sulfotransferase [Bacteroidota bacterium]
MNKLTQYLRRKFFVLNELRKKKTVVLIISSMRSGSTLLKSLLATAPDTSHLPEVDFQTYTAQNAWRIKTLSNRPILILKKPAMFDDPNYPQFPPLPGVKKIVLLRDAYETVVSLRKMIAKAYPELADTWTAEKLLHDYWLPLYRKLTDDPRLQGDDTLVIRYEDVLAQPIDQTQRIFAFIGSRQREGVDSYAPPSSYQWAWGNDDGGEKIKSHRVQAQELRRDDPVLVELIENSEAVRKLRHQLGYQ